MIALFVFQLFPSCGASTTQAEYRSEMIEELLEPMASIAEILMPCSKGAAFYKDKMTAADF